MPQPLPEDRPGSAVFSCLAEELVAAGITFCFQATGQSMFPTIRNGEVLHVEPLGEGKLRCGDIILFRAKGEFKAHRIIQIKREAFVARGDASLQADGEVDRRQIIGRVVAKECGVTGRLVQVSGMVAGVEFRLRRIRALVGRVFRRRSLKVFRPDVSASRELNPDPCTCTQRRSGPRR